MHNRLRRDLDTYLNHTGDQDIDPGDAAILCKQLLVRSLSALGGPVTSTRPETTTLVSAGEDMGVNDGVSCAEAIPPADVVKTMPVMDAEILRDVDPMGDLDACAVGGQPVAICP